MYHIGIAFAGDLFQLAYYDRAGCVVSGAHNIHENPGVLIRAVIGLSLLDESYVGKDMSITSRDRRAYMTVGGTEYEIVELLSAGGDILGKGTVCWRCRRPGSTENYVIKNTWTMLGQLRKTEGEFLRKAARVEGVPNLVCEEKVLRRNGLPQNTLWLRDTLDGLVHSPKNCAASWLAEPHHPQHNHTIYNQKRFRRVTEFDVFLLLGDSATTSNVAVGLVRCMRRASDELDRCETMQTSR